MTSSFFRKRHRKFSKFLSIMITFMMIFSSMASIPVAAIAAEDDITSISVTATDAHQMMASDYTLSFDLNREITDVNSDDTDGFQADCMITVDFGASDFNCHNLDSMDVSVIRFKVNGSDFNQEAKIWNPSDNVLTIIPQAGIAANSTISIEFKDILINPADSGNKYFATLRLYDETGAGASLFMESVYAQVKPVLLTMTAVDEEDEPGNETEVNIRQKIKIELKDDDGIILAKEDIVGSLSSFGARFYAVPADENANNQFTIPEGESSVDMYFVADDPDTYTISMNLDGGSLYTAFIPEPIEMNVIPTDDVNYGWNPEQIDANLTAGEIGKVEIIAHDQYAHLTHVTEDITFNLKATNVCNGEQSETAVLLAADEDGNLKDTEEQITSVTIPAGEDKATFYYKDTRATVSDSDYSLSIGAVYDDCSLNLGPAIYPTESVSIVLKTVPEMEDNSAMRTTTGVSVEIQAELQDKYGNKANL